MKECLWLITEAISPEGWWQPFSQSGQIHFLSSTQPTILARAVRGYCMRESCLQPCGSGSAADIGCHSMHKLYKALGNQGWHWQACRVLSKYSHGTGHYGFADIDKRKQLLPVNTTSHRQKKWCGCQRFFHIHGYKQDILDKVNPNAELTWQYCWSKVRTGALYLFRRREV